jgi:hypothetical protein
VAAAAMPATDFLGRLPVEDPFNPPRAVPGRRKGKGKVQGLLPPLGCCPGKVPDLTSALPRPGLRLCRACDHWCQKVLLMMKMM